MFVNFSFIIAAFISGVITWRRVLFKVKNGAISSCNKKQDTSSSVVFRPNDASRYVLFTNYLD